MDDLNFELEGSQTLNELLEGAKIGNSTKGEDIFSVKKAVKIMINIGMDELEARELFQDPSCFDSYPSMENAVFLNDLEL